MTVVRMTQVCSPLETEARRKLQRTFCRRKLAELIVGLEWAACHAEMGAEPFLGERLREMMTELERHRFSLT